MKYYAKKISGSMDGQSITILPPAPNGHGIIQTNEPCSSFEQTDEHTWCQ